MNPVAPTDIKAWNAADLESLWQDRVSAYVDFEANPGWEDTEEAAAFFDRLDKAETAIIEHPNTTLRAAELRLWIALTHAGTSPRTRAAGAVSTAIEQGNTAPLIAAYAELDFHEQAILIAILNLRGETL